jgi:hypothetical protein
MADWASRFPAILIGFFRPHLDGALSFEAWARRERAELPRYVDIPSRAEASRMVTDHVNAVSPSTAVLSLTGPSGAGVSRLVAEALTSAGARVVYTPSDGAALRLATSFVNQADAAAVLVVDHCSLDGRFKLEQMLLAEGHRIRAVLLCDPTQGAVRSSIALRRLGDQDVQRVIDANFPDTPSSHRRAFVHLADGILKIAVRLASAYGTAPSGFLADSSAWAFDELRRLVPDQQDMRVLQALSLFARVGFRGDVSSQMVTVCGLLGLESTEVLHRCPRLSRTPGVVSLGPRYLSVRPRLFAQSLFERAWDEHVAADVPAFIEALPPALEESLLTQAGAMAPKAPRESLANWATPTIRALAPADLGDAVRVQLNRFAFRWSHLKRATWPATRAGSVRKPSKVSTSAPSLSATVA